MIHFRSEDWCWDASLGAKGTAFLGTDFNTNQDLVWFEAHFPHALHYLFDAVELVLLPSYPHAAGATLDSCSQPLLLLNTEWLRRDLADRNLTGIEEVVVHERHHLIQLLEGRLTLDRGKGLYYWKGEAFPADQVGFGPGQHYEDLPWEREALWEQAKYLYLKQKYASVRDAFNAILTRRWVA